jgi:DnaJ-class molecular chaperone
MSEQSLRQDCEIVGIKYENINTTTVREVIVAYRKEALNVHPDKVLDESDKKEATKAFQALNNSYERILRFLLDNNAKEDEACDEENSDENEEERFMKDNFQNFNFPHENDGSFTVKIQHAQADSWQESLENKYGLPQVEKNNRGTECDRLWKFKYTVEGRETDITVHINQEVRNQVNC